MKKVYIVQRRLTHYRVPLFEKLRSALLLRDIQIELLIGQGTSEEEKKQDAGIIEWAQPVPTHYLLEGRLCWQPIRKYLTDADLVITTQENKLLHNHLLLLMPRKFKLAFWGHGANLQSNNPNGFKEQFKRWTTNQVDWWFAYTQMSAELVVRAGFSQNRITILNNTIDTSEINQQKSSITQQEIDALSTSLGLQNKKIGIYIGSLYPDKRLDFLFAAAKAIQYVIPSFQLLIIGDGQERDKVKKWSSEYSWVHWMGACLGREKLLYISMAQIVLNPGLVGLGILDSFICGVPMITTDCGIHSPEIAYLNNNVNGIITANNLNSYIDSCMDLLNNAPLWKKLNEGCLASANEYTIENMVSHFVDGTLSVINQHNFGK
jgi:L-malate glycosyltransferase